MHIGEKITIINILPQQSQYEYFKNRELPGKNWRNKKGEVVGITGNEFPHSLGNAILEQTDIFNYEVWQPDLRTDKIISYTFENNLVYRLFPAIEKKKVYGFKIIKNIYSKSMFEEIKRRMQDKNILIHLNGSLTDFNKNIIEEINDTPTVFSFHSVINLPSTMFFSPTRNIPSKINFLFKHFWVKKNINKINYITYQNNKNISHLRKIYKNKLEKITMGCDFSFWHKLNRSEARREIDLPRDKFILITVANFRDIKQIDKFIKILIKLSSKYDFLYLVIGHSDKEYENYLQEIATPLLKERKIAFPGYMQREALLKYLNSADLFVLTSVSEGASVAIMEAFACELPVFSTRTGNTAELMEKEKVGILVETKNYEEWERELEKIVKTKQLPRVLNRDIAKKHYDWGNTAQKLINIYKSLT
jgi:glycosyltransferase involved in cell wall biosynthesis